MHLCDRINNGMLFYEHGHTDPIDIQQERQLQEERDPCKEVMFEYNNTHPRENTRRQAIMKGILGSSGEQFFFEPPVHMSYGKHVHIGEKFYSNFNLVLVDDGEIFIGDNAVIGAGSIVTRDIPANAVAVGNPCRVMREISERDKEFPGPRSGRSLYASTKMNCEINLEIHSYASMCEIFSEFHFLLDITSAKLDKHTAEIVMIRV